MRFLSRRLNIKQMDDITVRNNNTLEYRGEIVPYPNGRTFIAENRDTSTPDFEETETFAISYSEYTQSPSKRAELIAAHSAARS